MTKNKQKLLQELAIKSIEVIKNLHKKQKFPFGDLKLNRRQVMILFLIAETKQGKSVKDLAQFFKVTPGAITQLINVLVDYKLVCRYQDIQDRRSVHIILSSSAKARFKKFKSNYFNVFSAGFKDFKIEELENFTKLIRKIKI